MRQQSIEHVGQVRTAILETNGAVSFFFYPHDESKPGLPMLPKVFQQRTKQVAHVGLFPCAQVQYLGRGRQAGRQARDATRTSGWELSSQNAWLDHTGAGQALPRRSSHRFASGGWPCPFRMPEHDRSLAHPPAGKSRNHFICNRPSASATDLMKSMVHKAPRPRVGFRRAASVSSWPGRAAVARRDH